MTRSSRNTLAALAAAVLLVLAVLAWRHATQGHGAAAPPALAVSTLRVERRAVADVLEASGKIIASQSAEVRAQASGVLLDVLIGDGDTVKAGQPLFRIDAQPLRAALAQAQANLAKDQAQAQDAQQTEARLKPLADEQFVSAQDYQNALNNLHSARASVAAAKALVDEARIALGYAEVRAPIDGRAGAVLVKPGNLVSASSASPLLVINSVQPADVAFALPQQQVLRLRAAQQRDGARALPVIAFDPNSAAELERGELFFTDNAFDDGSGTLGLRARFANTAQRLWPGQFVTLRVVLDEGTDALAVPESALQQGQQGPYVYVVSGGKAVLRPLSVARIYDGFAVVSKGLSAGDEIVRAVPNNLRDGMAVQTQATGTSP